MRLVFAPCLCPGSALRVQGRRSVSQAPGILLDKLSMDSACFCCTFQCNTTSSFSRENTLIFENMSRFKGLGVNLGLCWKQTCRSIPSQIAFFPLLEGTLWGEGDALFSPVGTLQPPPASVWQPGWPLPPTPPPPSPGGQWDPLEKEEELGPRARGSFFLTMCAREGRRAASLCRPWSVLIQSCTEATSPFCHFPGQCHPVCVHGAGGPRGRPRARPHGQDPKLVDSGLGEREVPPGPIFGATLNASACSSALVLTRRPRGRQAVTTPGAQHRKWASRGWGLRVFSVPSLSCKLSGGTKTTLFLLQDFLRSYQRLNYYTASASVLIGLGDTHSE